jgi:ABC-type polysaccharide/polyol phosphate transport system ATPase subunit
MSPGSPNVRDDGRARPAAIEVDRVSKTFRLPHERRTTLKEYFLHPLHRTGYEHQRALEDISFRVEPGEFFGIIGPNGSGKSTLLKIIAGIYRQDEGTVEVDGLLSPFIELGVGFNPELTGRDNTRINATLLGLSKSELDKRYAEIVAFSELERFMDQKLKNFSSGMQVRLAYAIGIQVDFDILLLDEVLAVGDAAFQEKCFASFERFRAEGRTIVLVTHALDVVQRFADRAALLLGGRMHALGHPDEVTETYRALASSLADAGAFAT